MSSTAQTIQPLWETFLREQLDRLPPDDRQAHKVQLEQRLGDLLRSGNASGLDEKGFLEENTMSSTVQFIQQAQVAEPASETVPSGPCGLQRIERTFVQSHRPKRIRACIPPPQPAIRSATQAMISAYVPYPGRSVLHKRIHANNIAAIGQMQAQQLQVLAQQQQVTAMKQQLQAQQQIATATGVIAQAQSHPWPDGIDPRLSDVQYSLIADVVAVAAHLMDKDSVTSDSFLNNKLKLNTAPLIDDLTEKLIAYKLDMAGKAFASATDPAKFEKFVEAHDLESRDVYDEINLRAGYLLMTMLAIAAASIEGDAYDWPAPPDVVDIDTGPATGPVPGTTPTPAPAPAAATEPAAKQTAPRIGTKRAKKIAGPRSKR
jgi:hypothetical protein